MSKKAGYAIKSVLKQNFVEHKWDDINYGRNQLVVAISWSFEQISIIPTVSK